MTEKIKLFSQYQKNGLRVLIPKPLKVRQNAPELFAEGKGGAITMIVEVNPPLKTRETRKDIIQNSPITNPMLDVKLIRRRSLKIPYKGWERIIEISVGENLSFAWELYFEPTPETFISVGINSIESFDEHEELWSKVIQSIEYDGATTSELADESNLPIVKTITLEPEDEIVSVAAENWIPAAVPFARPGEVEQGYSAGKDYFFVGLPSNCIRCKVLLADSGDVCTDDSSRHFVVPISVPTKLQVGTVSGPIANLDVAPGAYDVTVNIANVKKVKSGTRCELLLWFQPRSKGR
jgi:hypothetical protein